MGRKMSETARWDIARGAAVIVIFCCNLLSSPALNKQLLLCVLLSCGETYCKNRKSNLILAGFMAVSLTSLPRTACCGFTVIHSQSMAILQTCGTDAVEQVHAELQSAEVGACIRSEKSNWMDGCSELKMFDGYSFNLKKCLLQSAVSLPWIWNCSRAAAAGCRWCNSHAKGSHIVNTCPLLPLLFQRGGALS